MCQVVTRYSVNLATFFIWSEQVPQKSNALINDQMLPLSTYHSSFVFRRFCFQISPKRLVVLTDTLWALPCKLSYNSFLAYDKLWLFDGWNMWSMCYSASQNFMHVSTKHGEFPLRFQLLKSLPRKDSSQRSLTNRSRSTTITRRILSISWYSGHASTVFAMFCGKE